MPFTLAKGPPKRKKPGSPGYVYIMSGAHLHKIGTTRHHPSHRLESVRRESPVPITLVYFTKTPCAGWVEHWTQWIFYNHWVHHEWFDLDEADLEEAIETIEALRDGWVPDRKEYT